MRAVSLLTGPPTHLDHLGILSHLLEIPLIVTEESAFKQAQDFYPLFDIRFEPMSALSFERLAADFDLIFQSGRLWTSQVQPFVELLFGKKIRCVYCPHGNSDKGHSFREHPQQDIHLVYGDQLFDLLKQTGALATIQSTFRTGNYRLAFYRKHRAFYDALAEKQVFSHFKTDKPLLFYAPSWDDGETPSSFFAETDNLISQLEEDYNLLIKPHPFLEEVHFHKVLCLRDRYINHPSVHFLSDFPPIYPLLARAALYLGDTSSIGYDFLAFDRPLYFFHESNKPLPLHRCGHTIPSEQRNNLKQFLQQTLSQAETTFQTARRETYAYAFGKEKELSELKREIWEEVGLTAKTL